LSSASSRRGCRGRERKRRERLRLRREAQKNSSSKGNSKQEKKADDPPVTESDEDYPSVLAGVRAPPLRPVMNDDYPPHNFIPGISPLQPQHSSHVFEEDELRDAYLKEGSGSITAPQTTQRSSRPLQRVWMITKQKGADSNNDKNNNNIDKTPSLSPGASTPASIKSNGGASSRGSSRSRLSSLLNQARSS